MYLKKSFKASPIEGAGRSFSRQLQSFCAQACEVTKFCRSMWYYKKIGRDDQVIRMRMKEIAETRVRYGSERIFTLLRREGLKDSYNRVYRLYKLEGLNLRSKRPRRNRAAHIV
jgi:putative transposase